MISNLYVQLKHFACGTEQQRYLIAILLCVSGKLGNEILKNGTANILMKRTKAIRTELCIVSIGTQLFDVIDGIGASAYIGE